MVSVSRMDPDQSRIETRRGVPKDLPSKMKFWDWFGHAFRLEHSVDLLAVGNGVLVIHGMQWHQD